MSVDNLYFKDKNKGKTETVVDTYTDCNGEEFCVTREVELPYIQEQEILAPVFISTTVGSDIPIKGKLMQDAYYKKGKFYIHVNRAFRVGDIFEVNSRAYPQFYLRKKLKRDNLGNFVFQIARRDGETITSVELERLKKGYKVRIIGYFTEKNN